MEGRIVRQLFFGLARVGLISILCSGVAGTEPTREPVVGLPCEGCEAVFEGMPDSLGWLARIAPENEPGTPLRIVGTVRNRAGSPRRNVIIYAYQTDARGIYPRDESAPGPWARRHGRLRGWARTDEDGHYRFDTIRPGGYPDTGIPQHIHMHVIEPGKCTYYIDDILFEDDPRLDHAARRQMHQGRGGGGIVQPVLETSGVWLVRRDIILGENIPGYPKPGDPKNSKPR